MLQLVKVGLNFNYIYCTVTYDFYLRLHNNASNIFFVDCILYYQYESAK